jgi:hypothetical protein
MIGKIKNKIIRRVVLIVTLPVTIPLSLAILLFDSAPGIIKDMAGEISECWRRSSLD